ncbi:MAG TPA: V-type ATP synthase subunit E, partial [Clostridiales bacterium]|nr:V-type ATP synthase subunit E [Clostridiales bacterium]
GGFVLRRSNVDVNFTYDALLKKHRDELELMIAEILF